MTQLRKFLPLEKMEEQSDGTLHVFGIVTAEEPDLEKEVCDYAGTKPQYEEVAAEQVKKTSLPGMTPSVMPFREMHQPIVQGAGRSLVFDDDKKVIRMGFHVVDAESVKKWKAGCFVGFSQGGDYIKRWPDPANEGCTRYIARPAEVSAVDAPCLPIALVETMKGRTVQLMKSTKELEQVPLQIGTLDQRLNQIEKQLSDLLKKPQSEREKSLVGARALTDRENQAVARTAAAITLKKGLYEVGWLASLLQDLRWLCINCEMERDDEGDESKVPAELKEVFLSLIETFKAMAAEEADELAATAGKGRNTTMAKITDQAGLTKAAKTLHEHLGRLAEIHESHNEHMKKAHQAIQDKHEALGEHIEKCMKAAKDAMDGEEPEKALAVAAEGLEKIQADFAELKKQHEELMKKLTTTPAGTAPATGVDPAQQRGGAASAAPSVDNPFGSVEPVKRLN